MGIISYLSTGYQSSFNSPYSLETCKEILLKQHKYTVPIPKLSRFDTNNWYSGNLHRVTDIYPETPNRYTFRIEYFYMAKSGRGKHPYAVKGILEGGDNNPTQVTCESVYDRKDTVDTLWVMVISNLLVIILSFFILIYYNARSARMIPVLTIFTLLATVGYTWFIYVYKKRQIVFELQRWLDGLSATTITDRLCNIENDSKKYQFDFYVQDKLEECILRLIKSSQQGYYLYTSVGMIKGKRLDDGYFIAIQQVAPSQHRFLITNDTHTAYHQITAEAVGELINEDNVTHVRGYANIKTKTEIKLLLAGGFIFGSLFIWYERGLIASIFSLISAVGMIYITRQTYIYQVNDYLYKRINKSIKFSR